MTKFLAGAIAATIALAAPAGAATFTFDFTSLRGGTLQTNGLINAGNGGMGNVRSWTVNSGGESLTLRATGWASSSNGTVVAADLGRWENGLGVLNPTDGGANAHAFDNVGSLDFVLFEFSRVVTLGTATTITYDVDGRTPFNSDMGVLATTLPQELMGRFNATDLTHNAAWIRANMTQLPGGDTNVSGREGLTRDLSAFGGNVVILGAGAMGDGVGDGFKLRALSVDTGASVVPEPATWAMMIAGFGMIGAGLRRRHGVARPAAA